MPSQDETPGESRIPVLRSGIPVAFGGSRVRSGIPLPPVRATRPTALTGLTAHWPATSNSQDHSPDSTSSSPTTSDSIGISITGAHLGCEVIVGGTKPGVLRYFGTLPFDTGLWCGVELHKPEGLNDGSVKGIRLFRCRPLHGVVAPREKVALLPSPLTNSNALIPTSPAPLPPPPAPHLPPPSIPSRVKRQRTDAYECASEAAVDEDEGSTPRQTTAPSEEENSSEEELGEERWSAEDESTPPAEEREARKLPSPSPRSRARKLEGEDEDKVCPQSLLISPSSLPTPITSSTLEWSQPDISSGDSGGCYMPGGGCTRPHRHLRSSSDGSLCEMAFIPKTSTPTSLTSVVGTPFSSVVRCSRRGHQGNGGNKRCTDETCCCGLGISKQSSFDLDESLGILSPDQMDTTLCMESYGRTPSSDDVKRFVLEDRTVGIGMSSSHDEKRHSGAMVLAVPTMKEVVAEANSEEEDCVLEGGKEGLVEVQSDGVEEEEERSGVMERGEGDGGKVEGKESIIQRSKDTADESVEPASVVQAQPPSRPTQVSSTCFVASVTSITSIDPGYQGDGEWSRPASRADNSPGSSAPPGIGANVGLSVDVLKIKFDTMTDSDFYSDTGAGGTESDADHEEAAREGAMAAGDRRAQVIDGTLYGGMGGQHGSGGGICNVSHQQPQPRCFAAVMTSSTATTTEEMESSGVFSDLDRRADLSSHGGMVSSSVGGGDSSVEGCLPLTHQNSQSLLPRPPSAQGITSSAAESSDVPQSPLEELPEDPKKNIVSAIKELEYVHPDKTTADSELCGDLESTLVSEKMGSSAEATLVDTRHLVVMESETIKLGSPDAARARNLNPSPMTFDATPIPTPNSCTPFPRPSSAPKKEAIATPDQVRSPRKKVMQNTQMTAMPPKKYKMPKRNVGSKIKAMIEAPKEEANKEEAEARRQSRAQGQKKGRWDAIMSKIAAGQAEQKTSRPRLREVKSRVLANISTLQSNVSIQSVGGVRDRDESETRVRAKKPFISNVNRTRRAETRRSRARGLDLSSLRDSTCTNAVGGAAPPGVVDGSLNHSAHSSLSDVSVSQGAISKASSRSSKKRDAGRSASPFSDGSSNSGASNIPRTMPSPYHHHHHGAAISRQQLSSHSQKERTRDTADNYSNALTMASSTSSAALVRRNILRNNQLTSSSSAAKRVVGIHRKSQTEKTTSSEMKTPQTRKPMSRHLAPSSAQMQKPGSIKDGNRLGGVLVNKNGTANRGNTLVVVPRQQIQLQQPQQHVMEPHPLTAPENVVEDLLPQRGPHKGPLTIPSNLLQELKHSSAGVEALGVLVQYLVFDLEAFSTPHLKKMVDSFKAETISSKLNLDEAIASCRQLDEAAELSKERHKEEIIELINKHQGALSELEVRLNTQVEETQCRYEEELKRRERLTARNTEALLDDVKLYAERAEKAEREKEELRVREEDLKMLNIKFEKEIAEMQERFRLELTEVSRTGESGKLRDEIGSLQAVLDLRTKEMHEYRKKAEEWWHKSEALNSAVARAAALQARVEDLEAQLQRKVACERKLQEKVRHLSESMERECRQNEQLVLENEVLEWKVNESTKLMASLSGQSDISSSMTGSMMASSSPSSDRRSISAMAHSLGSPESPPAFMFPRFSPRLSPKSPFSDVSGTLELEEEEDDEDDEEDEEEEGDDEVEIIEENLTVETNKITPKMRTLVEKNESISWLVEMEEVIPAGLTSHIPSSALGHTSHHCASPPDTTTTASLDVLPCLSISSQETHPPSSMLPPTSNSPSTSPTSSDPSSSMFCVEGLLLSHSIGSSSGACKGAMPPSKKTRLERGKGGTYTVFSSTPIAALQVHNHHRHHARYQHQSRPLNRIPPSSSPLGSARSRSVSTDSESLDRDRLSPMMAATSGNKSDSKGWYHGGNSCNSWVERVPVLNVPSSAEGGGKWALEREDVAVEANEGERVECEQSVRPDGVIGGSGGGLSSRGEASSSEEDVHGVGESPQRTDTPSSSTKDKSPSKRASPYCELSEDFSDQSPYHSKGDSNDGYVLTDDNSSSIELAIGLHHKKQLPCSSSSPPPGVLPLSAPSSSHTVAAFRHSTNQGIVSVVETSIMMHHTHHPHHHHHYQQQQHVLSSLCAHPHLSIKESAGEAMISEEISDDTQGESEEEEQRTGGKEDKFPDSENEDIEKDGGISCEAMRPFLNSTL